MSGLKGRPQACLQGLDRSRAFAWGPKGFTNTFHTYDLREGGTWSFVMHGPEGGNYRNECVFLAVREPELLVWDRKSKPLFQVEVNFEAVSENETKVTFKQ